MKINSARFGEIEVEEEKIVNFPLGIPGFPELKRYVLIDYKDPIKWLHAVDDPDIAFIVTDPFGIFTDYSVKVGDDVERFLDIKGQQDAAILTILTVTGENITANLKAPIILNVSNFKAVQVLLDDERYQFKVPLPAIPREGGK